MPNLDQESLLDTDVVPPTLIGLLCPICMCYFYFFHYWYNIKNLLYNSYHYFGMYTTHKYVEQLANGVVICSMYLHLLNPETSDLEECLRKIAEQVIINFVYVMSYFTHTSERHPFATWSLVLLSPHCSLLDLWVLMKSHMPTHCGSSLTSSWTDLLQNTMPLHRYAKKYNNINWWWASSC